MIVHLRVPWKEVPTAGEDHKTTGRHCSCNANCYKYTRTHREVVIIK